MTIDWDGWRQSYDSRSFGEHQQFYREVVRLHPEQRYWNGSKVAECLDRLRPETVADLGGWDGSLAAAMLPDRPWIRQWTNYEIAPDIDQACSDGRYQYAVLDDWPWMLSVDCALLIASHVIEHMRAPELLQLLWSWRPPAIYIDTPISVDSPQWNGYEGTHILEIGGKELLGWLVHLGYSMLDLESGPAGVRLFAVRK